MSMPAFECFNNSPKEKHMRNHIPVLIATLMLAAATGAVFAKGPGGGAGGGAVGAPGTGGVSSEHFSQQGAQNSNGPNAADRDKGLERAEDRMSQEGLENSRAEKAPLKRQPKPKDRPAKPSSRE